MLICRCGVGRTSLGRFILQCNRSWLDGSELGESVSAMRSRYRQQAGTNAHGIECPYHVHLGALQVPDAGSQSG